MRSTDPNPLPSGAQPYTYWEWRGGQVHEVHGGLVSETRLAVYLNGQLLAALMCSPLEIEALAVGYAYNAGLLSTRANLRWLGANARGNVVDLYIWPPPPALPAPRLITSGCGGDGVQALVEAFPPLESTLAVTPQVITRLLRELDGAARLYQGVRGAHTSILADVDGLRLAAEDIGRHNTLDKLAGRAFLEGTPTRDHILVSSGRISSEMVFKARRMGVPIVASRTAPTSAAIHLAETWNICAVGYLRRDGMRVYTHPQRLGLAVAR